MRLSSLAIRDSLPIRRFEVDDLSDVVVLAGPNGVGKTRLLQGVISYLRGGSTATTVGGTVQATNPKEVEAWGGRKTLDLSVAADMRLFSALLQINKRRQKWQSSLINFESDRSIQALRPLQFSFEMVDPDEEELGWDSTFGFMRDRFQDTVHAMFRMIEAQKQKIASRAIALRREGAKSMKLEFPDPMDPFKQVFSQLLGPKKLVDPSARSQRLEYEQDGEVFEFATLSSGEREVVNIAFDFLLRSPQDCIVFFDEPELHLHPELSYRLIQTLQTIGTRNQFFLSTHSADIITASLDQSVVFISPAHNDESDQPLNQAVRVSEDDETNRALRLLGQSIGIVALGRRIVLIEGARASLDKQTYGSIVRGMFPNLVLVPSGGKDTIASFDAIHDTVLSKTIWGVEFFMLCDGDTSPADPAKTTLTRLATLPRYHIENYFLHEDIWAEAFAFMESTDSWLRDATKVRSKFRELAGELVSYATALTVSAKFRLAAGNVDLMPKDCHGKGPDEIVELLTREAADEVKRIGNTLDRAKITEAAQQHYTALRTSIETDTDEWQSLIPGKPLLGQFARAAGLDPARAKTAYINAVAKLGAPTFKDITDIFEYFSTTK